MQSLPLLLRLLFAHLIADVAFSHVLSWREQCGSPRPVLFTYLVGGLLRAGLVYLLAGRWNAVWIVLLVWAVHVGLEALLPRGREAAWRFVLRHVGYAVLLAGSWMAIAHIGPARLARVLIQSFGGRGFWAVAVALVLVVWPVGQLIGLLTDPWRRRIDEASRQGLENAGLWIGRLERVLILIAVLIGRYEMIGFLVAAKSILRFADVRSSDSRQEAEYILVGTMLSYAAALGIGLAARSLLR